MKAMSGKLAVATILFMVVTLPAIGKEVFLSDLEPISSHVLSGVMPGHGDSPVKDEGRLGEPLILNGVKYEKGLMMHVHPDGTAEAIYDVSGFSTFRADIGIDENNGAEQRGSVVFSVFVGDGKSWEEKFKSDVIRGDTPTLKIEIDLSGAPQLRLFVTDAGDGIDADHATWANARIDTQTLTPVKPLGKLSTTWGRIKAAY